MADETTRIINLTEATEIADGMYLVTDASTGTRKLSLQKILDKAGANVFDVYDPTSTYAVGDLCVYSGTLYECSTAITTPEAWNSAHWTRADLSAIIKDIDDSIDELYEDKADKIGDADNLVAGSAKQLLGSTIATSNEPYLLKKTGVDSNREKLNIVGLTFVWNQLCNGSSVTVTSGHKYYMKKAGVESIGASDGTALTGLTSGEDMVIDLTQLFGSPAIANHIYSLEQSKPGSGVAWVHKYIGIGSYRDYSAPTLTSVDNLDEHILSGFNQMSVENFTTGNNYNKAVGEQLNIGESGCTVSGENPVIITNTVADIGAVFGGFPLIPGQEYTISYRIKGSTPANIKRSYYITDENAYILHAENFSSVTHDENYVYVDSITSNVPGGRFIMAIQSSTAQTVEVHDLCVHLKEDGKRDGEYEPYETHEYPLDYMITLRGLAKLDSNGNLYADGDIYPPSGEVSVRFGQRAYQSGDESLADAITDGTNTVYKLSTPTTATANPYPEVQLCNKYGTEEFKTTDGLVPVGNTTEYLSDIQSQVKNLQDKKADKAGEYENLVAGSSEQLLSSIHTTNTEPYLFRKTGGDSDRERVKRLEGMSVGWNQLIDISEPQTYTFESDTTSYFGTFGNIGHNCTAIAGHKYLFGANISRQISGNNMVGIGFISPVTGIVATIGNGASDGWVYEVAQCSNAQTGSSFSYNNYNGKRGYSEGDTISVKESICVDLTALFGSTIADYIYTLEQATAGSGVAWVKQYIDLDSYHAYSAPTIKSVEGLTSHDMVGWNQWDEEWEVGGIDHTTGQNNNVTTVIRSKNYIPCLPSTVYCYGISVQYACYMHFYDKNKAYIGYQEPDPNTTFTTPSNAHYMRFNCGAGYGTTYNHDICINLSDPSRNGQYEPYEKHSYPLDSTITLRGIPKLVDGKLVADGDWYEPSGDVSARYALDQMTYTYLSGLSSDYIGYVNNATYGNMIWVRNWNYQTAKARQSGGIGAICNAFPVFMNDTDFTSSQNRTFFAVGSIDTVEAFLTYVQNLENNGNGLFIVYELATPTTSTASPYTEVQVCESGGTEEFVTDSPVPVGHVTEYTADLRRQVENIYGIPPVPEEDGEYTLHATVAEGVKTFTWESEA